MTRKLTQISATIAVALATFIGSVMMSALNVALPIIQKEFTISAVTLTWVSTSYILSNAVFLIVVGKIADIFGRKKIFISGIGILALSTLFSGFCNSIVLLLGLRIIQGIGSAMINATAMAIISSVFPPHRRGFAIGIATAAIYTGLSLGPFLGGIITATLGWRYIFFLAAPLEIIPFFLTIAFVKEEWADARGETYDLPGSLLYAVSLSLFMYGVTLLPAVKALAFLIPGITGLVLFVRREMRISFPVFEVSLFRSNRVFAFSSIAALIHYASTYAITFLLSLYLQISLNVSPQLTGIILAAQPITQAILSPIAGRLSDRIEPAILVSTGMAITSAGLFMFSFLTTESSVYYVTAVLFFIGSGYAFFSSPNTNAIMSSIERKYYGLASGTVATMRSLGMVLSMGVTTIVFSAVIGDREIGPETLPEFSLSVKISFIIFSLICMVGVYFSAVRGNLEREEIG